MLKTFTFTSSLVFIKYCGLAKLTHKLTLIGGDQGFDKSLLKF